MSAALELERAIAMTERDRQWLIDCLQLKLDCLGDAIYTARCRRILRCLGAEPINEENTYERALRKHRV